MELMNLVGIEKVYETNHYKTPALNGINLKVEKNELIAIMGPSGCGKSTLMNILGLIDKPTNGEYFLEGKESKNLSDKEASYIRNKKIGFIYQNFALIKELNILDNVILPLNIRGLTKKQKIDNALKYLNKVGLADLYKKYPYQLSGGQQQRVAIARALAQESEIILADEPTGNLDEKNGDEIMNLLIDLNTQGKTVIIITHDEKIASCCNRIIRLKDGKIISNK